MNHKQKLGYMALGAGILALGIIIGQWTTPPIEAQNNGTFDEIICRKLWVVDENDKAAILLSSDKEGRGVTAYDENGKPAIYLASDKAGSLVAVYDKQEKAAIVLSSFFGSGTVKCRGLKVVNEEGKPLVELDSSGLGKGGGTVKVFDEYGVSVGLITGEKGNSLGRFDKIESRELEVHDKIKTGQITVVNWHGEPAIELGEHRLVVYSSDGKERVSLNNLGRISAYDEHGKVGISLSSDTIRNAIDIHGIHDKNQETGITLSTTESGSEIDIRGKHGINGVRLAGSSDYGNGVVVYKLYDHYEYPRVYLGSGITFGGIAFDGVTVVDKERNVEWKAP